MAGHYIDAYPPEYGRWFHAFCYLHLVDETGYARLGMRGIARRGDIFRWPAASVP